LNTYNQTEKTSEYFASPVRIPIYLSGTFGELRTNHFHSGIDIKTQGVTGKVVQSIEDGYVSRIKITSKSYGRALYIAHNNGYTSVYGHLDRFTKNIEQYVKTKQYEKESHVVDLFPDPGEFPVKKKEIIGYSGNSGYSFGPHLHFEIRNSVNQHPLNPLNLGIKVKDEIHPGIYRTAIYPLATNSLINGEHKKTIIKATGSNGNYKVTDNQPVEVSGKIGFGIETYDYHNGSRNRCGIHSIELLIDSIRHYYHIIDEFAFNETRYINSLIDYEAKQRWKYKIQKSFVQPNNPLNIYKDIKGDGSIVFNDTNVHHIQYNIKDIYDNTSSISFLVKNKPPHDSCHVISDTNYTMLIPFNQENHFSDTGISIKFPKNSLYDTLKFKYAKKQPEKNMYSDIHIVHNQYTPVQKYITLSIQPNMLNEEFQDNALIIKIDDDDEYESMGGSYTYADGYVTAFVREFGEFAIAIDTTAPEIIPFHPNKTKYGKGDMIAFKATDELTGIAEYTGYIDNQWALFEYDYKNDKIMYFIDEERLQKNQQHTLELFVIDEKDNIASYHTTFYY
jgi:murein DD-endopeptidase MepM/ murein hydrolase activator NlpD